MPKLRSAKKEPRAWARTKGGMVKGVFTLSAEQDRAIREEAFRRAKESGSLRPDASAVLREVLDAWLARRRS